LTFGAWRHGGRRVNASRTPFIPEKLLGLFERTTWPVVSADTTTRTASHGPKLDISAGMRERSDRTYRNLNRRTASSRH
jgi:DNA helicase-2/ATP-dependent DNA helicase PcrA